MGPERPTPPPFPWADRFFTVGVTGTNGKTSTVHLVAHALAATGEPCLLLGTTGYYLDGEELGLPHTDYGFFESLRRANARGARLASIEVTSKALAEGYAKKWRFDCAVFTNLSPDHLSTHGSYEHYLAAKAQLFMHLGPGARAVLNGADPHALFIDKATPADVKRFWFASPTRGELLVPPDLAAARIVVEPAGTRVQLQPSPVAEQLGGELRVRMVGAVYAENAMAAAGAALAGGIPADAIVRGLAECPPVPGRFEVFALDPVLVVDYAHTPDALERTCTAARELCHGRLAVVFGAGGGSTPSKRGPMGAAVGSLADVAIVTNDNPRKEDPAAIAAAVVAGVESGGRAEVVVELDRRAAIERAVAQARPGDVVIVAGKGHETGQTIGDETVPFSDREIVRSLAAGRP
jgi:UDP-N-acetylmuramoyl-L-alanyl-D-glutamate--2,6-diaminopimelate ligase